MPMPFSNWVDKNSSAAITAKKHGLINNHCYFREVKVFLFTKQLVYIVSIMLCPCSEQNRQKAFYFLLPYLLIGQVLTVTLCKFMKHHKLICFGFLFILLYISWHSTSLLKIQFLLVRHKKYEHIWCENTIYRTDLQIINCFPSNRRNNFCENTAALPYHQVLWMFPKWGV